MDVGIFEGDHDADKAQIEPPETIGQGRDPTSRIPTSIQYFVCSFVRVCTAFLLDVIVYAG